MPERIPEQKNQKNTGMASGQRKDEETRSMRSRKQRSWIRDPHPKQIKSNCPASYLELTRRHNKATSPLSIQSSINKPIQSNRHRVIPLIKRKRYQFFIHSIIPNHTRGLHQSVFSATHKLRKIREKHQNNRRGKFTHQERKHPYGSSEESIPPESTPLRIGAD